MRKKLAAAFIMVIIFTGAAYGARHESSFYLQPHFEIMRTLMQMKITESQKHEIAGILMDYKNEFKPVTDSIKSAKNNLRKAILAKSPDKKLVLDAYGRLASSGEEFVLLITEMITAIKSILTPEQLAILEKNGKRIGNAIDHKIKSRRHLLNEWIKMYAR